MSRLSETAPELEEILMRQARTAASFAVSEIDCETVWVTMRDGVRLATDIYLPPKPRAPVIGMRTCYGRAVDGFVGVYVALARRGYAVVSQDCRGTGDSEPDSWDYYMYEAEDSLDFVEWIGSQEWCDGFIGAFGGSYLGQTQWCMALHPRMSTIIPEVSGLGLAINTANKYMHARAFALTKGKGSETTTSTEDVARKLLPETLSGGYFNEPLSLPPSPELSERFPLIRSMSPGEVRGWLWNYYCSMSCAARTRFVKDVLAVDRVTNLDIDKLSRVFGQHISHDAHTVPHPHPAELCRLLNSPPLMVTGWYDWCLDDALATWEAVTLYAQDSVRSRTRLIITPSAHNAPGYVEDMRDHPELRQPQSAATNISLLLRWCSAIRENDTASWPKVIYYLMGANEWRAADNWPVPDVRQMSLYLGSGGRLLVGKPELPSPPDKYVYDPDDPTPTVGGSIVSSIYRPGSVDVSSVQERDDVLIYSTEPLEAYVDVVGPLRMLLYASSSAVDTDFCARLSDVFPDGRAIQLQGGMLRARYRKRDGDTELLEPGRIYLFEIDMWATANRFSPGHRIRLDISSADFPRFERNANRGGDLGPPLRAVQTIYHDPQYPSHLLVSVLGSSTH